MMRQRSSSRWSRNGISPFALFGIGMELKENYERALLTARGRTKPLSGKLVYQALRVFADDPLQKRFRRVGIPELLLRISALPERGRGEFTLRVSLRHELVDRVGGRWIPTFRTGDERLSDQELRFGGFGRVRPILAQVLEAPAGQPAALLEDRRATSEKERRRTRDRARRWRCVDRGIGSCRWCWCRRRSCRPLLGRRACGDNSTHVLTHQLLNLRQVVVHRLEALVGVDVRRLDAIQQIGQT